MNAPLTTDLASHTPGPWRVNKYGSIGAGQYGTLPIVAEIELLEGSDRKYGNHAANAHLIAAAPDLLAAAKRLRAVITDHVSLADVDALDAAIAKAEGRHV